MFIAPRLIRSRADDLTHPPIGRTTREQERHDRIVATGQTLLAEYGCHTFTFSTLALALRIGPTTLRRHFCDIDSLLAEILQRHLRFLMHVILSISRDDPGFEARRRAAYLDATRTAMGGFTEAHLLLVRDRHTLPEDLLATIEQLRGLLGASLCQDQPDAALSLLDNPFIAHGQIEPVLASYTANLANPAPAPETPAENEPRPIMPAPPTEAIAADNPVGTTLCQELRKDWVGRAGPPRPPVVN